MRIRRFTEKWILWQPLKLAIIATSKKCQNVIATSERVARKKALLIRYAKMKVAIITNFRGCNQGKIHFPQN